VIATGGLVCATCERGFPLWERRWRCECGAPLTWDGGGADAAAPGPGLWRHAWMLPPVDPAVRVTLGEGETPRVGAYKLESLGPTGSFKDRGACVVASCLRQMGVKRAVFDSSGNAGAAMAAYLAAAGIEAVVFAPATASPGKLRQIAAYGARLELVDGDRGEVTRRAQAWAEASGELYASHLWSPFFSAGLRTVAAELGAVEAVIVPAGSGSLLIGLHAGFRQLLDAGLIARLPALYGVQAQGCDPLVAAFEGRAPSPAAFTVAEGIRIAAPPRRDEAVAAVRESGGALVAVSDAEITAAADALARRGLFVEPTGAVGEAGRRRLGIDAVVVLTGTGLKALA
jgi:threonine synthase